MYYVTAESKDSQSSILWFREFENKNEAHNLKDLLILYSGVYEFLYGEKTYRNIKIRSIPYNQTDGFFGERFRDSQIVDISELLKFYIKTEIVRVKAK